MNGWTAKGSKLVRGLFLVGDPDGEGVLDELDSVEEYDMIEELESD